MQIRTNLTFVCQICGNNLNVKKSTTTNNKGELVVSFEVPLCRPCINKIKDKAKADGIFETEYKFWQRVNYPCN